MRASFFTTITTSPPPPPDLGEGRNEKAESETQGEPFMIATQPSPSLSAEPGRLHFERLESLAGDFLAEAAIDRGGGIVRNVALLGPRSRNGYRYAATAMAEAAPLYEGR